MNLKEAIKRGKLKQFAKEHEIKPAEQHPQGRERFDTVLDAMARGLKPTQIPKAAKPKK